MFVAAIALFVLPDFPATSANWLSPIEVRLAEKRMEEDVGVGDEEQTESGQWNGFFMAMTDWKVWWLALALTSMVVSLSFNAFFPTLSATLGFNSTVTLLLCAPPWVFSTIVAFIVCRHSDMTGERFWHIAIPLFFGIIGFVIAVSTMNTAARYVSLCVAYFLDFIGASGTNFLLQILNGPVLRWFHHLPHLDQQFHPSPTFQTCRRARVDQRLFAAGKRCRIVSLIHLPPLPISLYSIYPLVTSGRRTGVLPTATPMPSPSRRMGYVLSCATSSNCI